MASLAWSLSAFLLTVASLSRICEGGCFHNESTVIRVCQAGAKTGNTLHIEAETTVQSNEVCSCTFQQTIGGHVEIYTILGSVISSCGVAINFYSSDSSPLHKVQCTVDYKFNSYIPAYSQITFNMTGEGDINACISIRSSVQESLITVICTQTIEVATLPPTKTTRAPPTTIRSSSQTTPSSNPPSTTSSISSPTTSSSTPPLTTPSISLSTTPSSTPPTTPSISSPPTPSRSPTTTPSTTPPQSTPPRSSPQTTAPITTSRVPTTTYRSPTTQSRSSLTTSSRSPITTPPRSLATSPSGSPPATSSSGSPSATSTSRSPTTTSKSPPTTTKVPPTTTSKSPPTTTTPPETTLSISPPETTPSRSPPETTISSFSSQTTTSRSSSQTTPSRFSPETTSRPPPETTTSGSPPTTSSRSSSQTTVSPNITTQATPSPGAKEQVYVFPVTEVVVGITVGVVAILFIIAVVICYRNTSKEENVEEQKQVLPIHRDPTDEMREIETVTLDSPAYFDGDDLTTFPSSAPQEGQFSLQADTVTSPDTDVYTAVNKTKNQTENVLY